jgi:hypothetical protein
MEGRNPDRLRLAALADAPPCRDARRYDFNAVALGVAANAVFCALVKAKQEVRH